MNVSTIRTRSTPVQTTGWPSSSPRWRRPPSPACRHTPACATDHGSNGSPPVVAVETDSGPVLVDLLAGRPLPRTD